MKPLYTAVATATGDGRNGHVKTDDGMLDMTLKMPPGLGGPGGASNPEQLFAAGYAACFHSALKFVARPLKADVTDSTVRAHVSIGSNGAGGFGLGVTLDIHIPNVEPQAALELAQQAHHVCPYSNATRGNIDVQLQLS